MRPALCSLFLCSALCYTTAVQAQSQSGSRLQDRIPAFIPPATLSTVRPNNMGCPVSIRAERQASGQQEWIVALGDATYSRRPDTQVNTAGVHVELIGFRSKRMKLAQVEVDYMAPKGHVLLVNQASAAPPPFDLTKTFILSAAEGEPSMQFTGSLRVGHAASITRVRLLSIEYADGTTWQAKSSSGCSVEPGLLMAVASR